MFVLLSIIRHSTLNSIQKFGTSFHSNVSAWSPKCQSAQATRAIINLHSIWWPIRLVTKSSNVRFSICTLFLLHCVIVVHSFRVISRDNDLQISFKSTEKSVSNIDLTLSYDNIIKHFSNDDIGMFDLPHFLQKHSTDSSSCRVQLQERWGRDCHTIRTKQCLYFSGIHLFDA